MGKFSMILLLCFAGCLSIPPQQSTQVEPMGSRVEQAKAYMERRQPEKALEVLEKAEINAESFYLKGCAHIFLGQIDTGIGFYQKALEKQPGYDDAYVALDNIYQSRLLNIQAKVDDLENRETRALQEGKGNLIEIHQALVKHHREQAKTYISQAKTYMMYSNLASNIAAFSDLDAHLRDMQDLFDEKESIPTEYRKLQKEGKGKYKVLLSEIRESRRNITKKYTKSLLESGLNWASQGNYAKAIEALKETEDHASKFFAEERPTSKVSYLGSDDEVVALAKEINAHAIRYYREYLNIVLENKARFIEMGNWQDVEEQTHKMEEILQGWIQTEINGLWRFKKIPRERAEEQPELIELYELFLQHMPESSKSGEYHYRLARFYYNRLEKGDLKKAKKHAREAERLVGGYEIEKFLEKLDGGKLDDGIYDEDLDIDKDSYNETEDGDKTDANRRKSDD